MLKVTIVRALVAHIANRLIRFATIVVVSVFFVIALLSAFLASAFSGWWWLLVIPFGVLLAIVLLLRAVLLVIINWIVPLQLRPDQTAAMSKFIGKLERLIEARGTPPWIFALITIKDLVIHRDITTIKSLVASTTSLKRDYQELESYFSN